MKDDATQPRNKRRTSGHRSLSARLEVCGPLVVEIDGVRLESKVPGRKGRQLVAYLAINRHRALRRDELIDALWIDPPVNPEGTLATLLARTRAALGHTVIPGGPYLRLDLPPESWIDWEVAHAAPVAAVQAMSDGDPAGAARIAEEALGIVEQGFLPEVEGSWIEPRRRELDELRVELCDALACAALELGGEHLATAERAARALVEREPFRERGHALLIEVLSACGNDAEALRAFDRLRTLLREELGLTPAPAVTALVERVLQRQSEHERRSAHASAEWASAASHPGSPDEPIPLPRAIGVVAQRPIAGRQSESRRLIDAADDVAGGNRRVAVVCGEPGIGKTRLVVFVADELRRQGWRVMYGRADRENTLTYQPILEALREYRAGRSRLQPEIETLFGSGLDKFDPGVAVRGTGDTRAPEQRVSDPDLQRFRLFEAVAELFAAATVRQPVVLLLDDLHWADRSTLMLLRQVLRATAGCRLFVLATFRDLEEEMGPPLREFLDMLWHEELYDRVPLQGLALADSAQLVREHVPNAPPELVARLHDRTDGNPFYIEEILRGLAETQKETVPEAPASAQFPIPERVQQMIVWRVERLPAPASEVLRVGAVLGPEFDAARAAAVAGCSAEAALRCLEDARRAGLVTADAEQPDWYEFRHGLVREALYEATVPGRRVRMHLAVARLLESAATPDAGELAMHWWHARSVGGAAGAVHWHLEAAAVAVRKHAHEESVRHHRYALEALALLPADDRQRAAIILGEGRSLIRAGDLEAGRERLAHAAALARRLGAADILADSVIDAGAFYLSAGIVDLPLIEILEEARAGLLDSNANEDRARLARVMARLVVALYWDPGQWTRRESLAREAISIATDCGDPGALAWAVGSAHCSHWVSEQALQLLEEAERTIELAQRARDEELELIARTWRVNHLLVLSRVREVDEEIERFTALADRIQQSRCAWYGPLFRGARCMMSGRLDEAERLFVLAAELGGRIPGSPAGLIFGGQLFVLRWLQGRLAELEPASAAYVEQYPAVPSWRAGLAKVECAAGKVDDARARLHDLVADECAVVPHDGLWLNTVALLGDVCADTGALEHAQALERVLAPCSGLCAIMPTAAWVGPVDRVLGRLAALQEHWDEGLAYLAQAAQLCERASCPVALVQVRLDHAELLLSRRRCSDIDAVRAAARAALTGAETMGMRAATTRAVAILEHTDSSDERAAIGDGVRASA